MSADEKLERDEAPEEDNRPVVSGAILAWMQREGYPELFVPDQTPQPHGPERSEPVDESDPASDEILSTLLKAIQGTDVAAELERASAPDRVPFLAPEHAVAAFSGFESRNKGELAPELLQPDTQRAKLRRARAAKPRKPAKTSLDSQVEAPPPTTMDLIEASPSPELVERGEIADSSSVPAEMPQPVRSRRAARAGARTRQPRSGGKPRKRANRQPVSKTEVTPPSATPPLCTVLEAASISGAMTPSMISAIPDAESAAPEPLASDQTLPIFLAPLLPVMTKPTVAETAPIVADMSLKAAEVLSAAPAASAMPPPEVQSKNQPKAGRAIIDPGRLAQKVGLTAECLTRARKQLSTLFESLFVPQDSRRSRRLVQPPLIAYPWAAGSRGGQTVINISSTGLQLLSDEQWPPGGTLCMTLQRTDRTRGSPGSWIVVEFKVVRWCEGGLAGTFIPSSPGRSYSAIGRAENCADEKTLHRFVKQLAPPAQPPPDEE